MKHSVKNWLGFMLLGIFMLGINYCIFKFANKFYPLFFLLSIGFVGSAFGAMIFPAAEPEPGLLTAKDRNESSAKKTKGYKKVMWFVFGIGFAAIGYYIMKQKGVNI